MRLRPVSGGDRAARLRRPRRLVRAGVTTLSRLGRTIAEGRHAVLLPGSFGSRELGPQCRVSEHRVLARRERVADVMASRKMAAAAALGRARSHQPRCAGRHQLTVGLPAGGRRRTRAQCAGANRGLSRRVARFRPRQSCAACDRRRCRSRFAGKGARRHRPGGASGLAKPRRGVAGEMRVV